ncbi:MAG: hypothetical protein R3281_01010 [Balneolaceae bacterium]|nr:hypothetical protein [Balneolaceae bacterium]
MSDFNLNKVREIKKLLQQGEELHLDMEQARFVNSEAIIFLHSLLTRKRTVRITNPPKIFYEVLRILGLHEAWDLKQIVER